MGLQRAFHLAGARTVIASLWKVEDNATRALMTEFYKNLWEKKMDKLAALRAAQLTMIGRYDPKSRQLRGAGPTVAVDPDKLANSRLVGPRRDDALPPFYWAAFSLSGQCRPTHWSGD